MKLRTTVRAVTTNAVHGVRKGAGYEVIRAYWYNGEGWYRVRPVNGAADLDAPDVLFDDGIAGADAC